jgi:hypothetical protein
MTSEPSTLTAIPAGIDPKVANPARIYDYFLGGTHNFPSDREQAGQLISLLPCNPEVARSNRGFLRRAVDLMAASGIDQFLDLGSGLPTARNVHEVAQARNPLASVVYVDNDPIAVAHGEALLAENPGAAVIEADMREPGKVLNHPRVKELLDFSRPIGLVLVSVLSFVNDAEDPDGLVAAYRSAAVPGSYLAVTTFTDEDADDRVRAQAQNMADLFHSVDRPVYARDRADMLRWMEGTELLSPGVTPPAHWRPDEEATVLARSEAWMLGYAALGRVV